MKKMTKIIENVKLIENFQSYQGEGPDMGQAMIILRFKTCNLKCPWCDTQVKMRISAEAPHKLSDIQTTINETRSGILITGGEPTVARHFDECVSLLTNLNYPIANVESNGFALESLLKAVDLGDSSKYNKIHYMYSPKIFNEDDLSEAINRTDNLLVYNNVFIKVVYEDKPEIKEYLEWLSSIVTLNQSGKVWLMPEGKTRADLIRNSEQVFDACEKYRFNFSSRSHIIYGFV